MRKTDSIVMLISPDGKQAVGLYTDKFPWKEFGPLEVTRATEIEFDAEKQKLSLIHISEPTRLLSTSYAVFCLKKKKNTTNHHHAHITSS